MKDDELETVEHLHGKSLDKNIKRKEWRDFPQIKGYMIKKSESLKKKGWEGGKTKAAWDEWNEHRWEEMIIDLADVEMIGSTWRETRQLKRINMTISIIMKD